VARQLALVTGAQGFIGRHLTAELAKHGWAVFGVDRRSLVPDRSSTGVRSEQCDVTSRRFGRLLLSLCPDVVVHLAAQSSLAAMERDPVTGLRDNILGTASVVDACRSAGVSRLVFASSAAVYGQPESLPVREDAALRPTSSYGWSKLAGEQLVIRGAEAGGPSYAVLRFANVYGPGQEAKDEPGVIGRWLESVIAGQPLAVRSAGRPTRDFIYVKDVCAAIVAVAEGQEKGCFNIASGRETALAHLLRLVSELAGVDVAWHDHAAPAGDIDRSALSPAAAERAFNWQPATPLETGLAATYEHLWSIHEDVIRKAAASA
jgi:UDP-glucose 4-epimerase